MSSGPSTSSGGKRGGGRKRKEAKRKPTGWECTLCTFDNHIDAFKCAMCDTRKGTSTRKPRLSTAVVEQQQTVHNFVLAQQAQLVAATRHRRDGSRGHTTSPSPSTSSQPDQMASPQSLESPPSPGPSPASRPTPSPNLGPPSSVEKPSSQPTPPGLSRASSITPQGTPAAPPKPRGRPKGSRNGEGPPSHLKGVDRNSARTLAVTVNGVTVVITDYKLKPPRKTSQPSQGTPGKDASLQSPDATQPPNPSPLKEEEDAAEALLNLAPVTPPVFHPVNNLSNNSLNSVSDSNLSNLNSDNPQNVKEEGS